MASLSQFLRDVKVFAIYLAIMAVPAVGLIAVAGSWPWVAAWPPPLRALTIILLVVVGLTIGARILGDRRLARETFFLARIGRWLDRVANRNRFDRKGWKRFVALRGHSWKPTFLALLFAAVVIFGPDWWRSANLSGLMISLPLFLLVVALIVGLNYRSNLDRESELHVETERARTYRRCIYGMWAVMVALVLGVIVLTRSTGGYFDSGVYGHLWQFLGVNLLVLLLAANLAAHRLMKTYKGTIPETAAVTCNLWREKDLALTKEPSDDELRKLRIDWFRFFRSLVKAPIYHAVEILLFMSLPVLLVADESTMVRWAFYSGIVAWVLYAMGEMHERLDHLLGSLRRMFFLGGHFAVSLIVILLAGGRLFGSSYIVTLVEGEGWWIFSNVTLLGYIFSTYAIFWFYEYWANRLLNERLLAIIADPSRSVGRFKAANTAYGGPAVLQVHGGSRYANMSGDTICRTYGRMTLVNQLVGDSTDSGREHCLILQHRIRFYFTFLNIALVALLGAAGVYYYLLPQRPEVVVSTPPEDGDHLFDLQSALFPAQTGKGENACDKNVVLLAASGGGTRAALYTYSVMRGLRQIELEAGCSALHRTLLVSSVSGGSAAAAYFSLNRQDLLGSLPGESPGNPWLEFRETMTEPFIQDVLGMASEIRLLRGCRTDDGNGGNFRQGVRLSSLLRESFDRRLAHEDHIDGCALPDTESNTSDFSGLVGVDGAGGGIGLIFNTTIAGRYPLRDREADQGCPGESKDSESCRLPIAIIEAEAREAQTTSFGHGGRLVFTNLRGARELFPATDGSPTEWTAGLLNYAVMNDPTVPLTTAAALSANFPPVFPNAAVDKENIARYWVTDGGAADNRGLISLLFALEKTIDGLPDDWPYNLPDVHIVSADASGLDLVYAQDRGIGSAFGAAERFASEIITDKLEDIQQNYALRTGSAAVRFHNILMPLALRSDGGIGTHWMLPDKILVRPPFGTKAGMGDDNPLNKADPCRDDSGDLGLMRSMLRFLSIRKPGCEIDRKQTLFMLDSLHAPNGVTESTLYGTMKTEKRNALVWLCEQPPIGPHHEQAWASLVGELTDGPTPSYCLD